MKTPPYLTAEPEVTTTKIEPGDFLIMATGGLWEWLTSEDAVGLVGWWLDSRAFDPTGPVSERGQQPRLPKELPVTGDFDSGAVRVRTPEEEPRFVNKDDNVCTHLLRNALGGANEARLAELLSVKPGPEAMRKRLVLGFKLCTSTLLTSTYRDDITAAVVFFA